LEVGPKDLFETILGGFEEVVALPGGHAGVVDKDVEAPKLVTDGSDEALSRGLVGNICLDIKGPSTSAFEFFERASNLPSLSPPADRKVEAFPGEAP
jgi:hypothetical protein